MNSHLLALGISIELIGSRGLQKYEEAKFFEIAETGMDSRDRLLIPVAAKAWRQLKRASVKDGINLFIVSAFRSIDQQADIVRRKLETGLAIQSTLTICAPPSFSEHHTGCAVDVSTDGCHALEIEFDQTAAYAWLTKRAPEFGYYLTYPVGNAFRLSMRTLALVFQRNDCRYE